jgi:hypothetical protein
LAALEKLAWLQRREIHHWKGSALTPNRQKLLAQVARRSTTQALQRMAAERRYPLLLAFVQQTVVEITDEALDLFGRCLAETEARANHDLKAVQVVHDLNVLRRRNVPDDAPLDFIERQWLPSVVTADGHLDRHYYELCVLWELRNALRAGNVWLDSSRRYANPETYLIPKDRWPALRLEVCQQISLPAESTLRFTDQAGCLNLLTNVVVAWNAVYLAAAIEQLRAEGYPIRDEDIAHLSPARHEHINPYGKYRFDIDLRPHQPRPLRSA